MKFTVSGTDYDGTYEMIQERATFAEAKAIEKVTGHSFQALMKTPELQESMSVIQAMLWISMKRDHPTLTYAELDDFPMDAIEEHPDEPTEEEVALSDLPTDGDVGSSVETTSPLSD